MAFQCCNYYVLIFQGCMVQSGSLVRKASSTDAHYPPSELSNLLQGQRRREDDTMLILSWLFLVLMCVINNTLIILLTFPHFAPSSQWAFPFSAIGIHSPHRSTKWQCLCLVSLLFWCSGHEIYVCLRYTKFCAVHYVSISCVLMYGLAIPFICL